MFLGNTNLRSVNEVIDYDQKMLDEVIKCSQDVLYFAEKYYTIVTIDEGKRKIKLWDWQKKVLKALVEIPNNKSSLIIKIARQCGKSTLSSIYLLWYILFNKDKTAAIMANKESLAIELLDKIKLAYRELPIWLQQGIVVDGWNKKKLALVNGSRILAAATSCDALTGYTINLLYLDEFAKVPQFVADDFIASVYPVITSGKSSKIIMIGTPYGLNHFYNFWVGATRKDGNENSFYPISVGWWEVPGRDEKFKRKIIKDIGLQRWEQEYACKFLGSSSTLIDSDILERIIYKIPKLTKWTGLLSVYEEPLIGKNYVIGVDVSKGCGRDYSVIQVLKINSSNDIEQVAVYRNNQILPRDFAQICISVAKFYNNSYMMVENNDIGASVADSIWYDYEYENLVNLDNNAVGVRSTKKSKKLANILLKEYVEKGWLKLCDEKTIYELSRYEEIKLGVFAAGRHENDDNVTSLLWALYFIQTDEYTEKSYETKIVDDEFNVQKGNWEADENTEIPTINNKENKEDGNPNFIPSVVMDDE